MKLASRIMKLEGRAGLTDVDCVDIVIVQSVRRSDDGALQSKPCFAIFVGEDCGRFPALEGETEIQFHSCRQMGLEDRQGRQRHRHQPVHPRRRRTAAGRVVETHQGRKGQRQRDAHPEHSGLGKRKTHRNHGRGSEVKLLISEKGFYTLFLYPVY